MRNFTVEMLKSVVFGDEMSPRGEAKRAFFRRNRIICPTFPGITPHYRITWEFIREFLRSEKERVAELMRSAKTGAESARVYEQTPSTSPVEVLAKSINEVVGPQLMASVPGLPSWDPNNGFDMDLFLIVDGQFGRSKFAVDLFPRFDGKYIDAFACQMQEVEFVCLTGEESEVDLISTLILKEHLGEGENTPQRREEIIQEFIRSDDFWTISSTDLIYLFLSRGALSLCEDGRDAFPTMAAGGVVYGPEKLDRPSQALFTVGPARHIR
jgi:hypothetical protein